MRDFVLFCRNAVLVILLVFISDYVLGSIMDNKLVFIDQPKYSRIEKSENEVVILGASRADNQYVSSIIEDSLGLKTYNYGVGAQNIYTNYAILDLILEKSKKKPSLIIWDFYYTDIIDSPGWNTENMHRLYSAYSYSDTIKSVLLLQGEKKNYLLKYIKTYKFNSKLPMALRRLFIKESLEDGGYTPLYVKNEEKIKERQEDRGNIDPIKIYYINKMIDLCKSQRIKLAIFISPGFYRKKNINPELNDWSNIIEDIANKKEILFYDFEQDDSFLIHPEWFYNEIHLNDEGAKEYSKIIAHILKGEL